MTDMPYSHLKLLDRLIIKITTHIDFSITIHTIIPETNVFPSHFPPKPKQQHCQLQKKKKKTNLQKKKCFQ